MAQRPAAAILGITAFFLPLWLGGLGWTWMRSRPGGLAWLRWMGTVLALAFLPAVFGLLPWHWLWLHALPVEGVVGKLMAGLLVTYLNIQGAWLVAGVLAAAGLWFASAVSFEAIFESLQARWLNRPRCTTAGATGASSAPNARKSALPSASWKNHPRSRFSDADPEDGQASLDVRPGLFARLFHRRRAPEIDPQDIPAYQRAIQPAADQAPTPAPAHSIWERAAVPHTPATLRRPRRHPHHGTCGTGALRPAPTPPIPARPRTRPL
jgi:S-DNA-T family DNA segregation ATPase FtsK/SpoIIIE